MVGELCDSLKNNVGAACQAEVVIAPPAVYLQTAQSLLADSAIALAAQNCSAYGEGAYTGEISAGMLEEMRIPYVILGHSERRALFKETEKDVGTKVGKAMHSGLKVIACIGETLEQRESGDMYSVLEQQLAPIMDAVGSEASAWSNVVVAYEPVWYVKVPVIRRHSSSILPSATLTRAVVACVRPGPLGPALLPPRSRRRTSTPTSESCSRPRSRRKSQKTSGSSTVEASTGTTAASSRAWRTSTASWSAAPRSRRVNSCA